MYESKLRLYSQRDPRWKNASMQMPGQTLGKYGCLVTSISNYINMFHNGHMNPIKLNDKIKELNLYYEGSYLKSYKLLQYYSIQRVDRFEEIVYMKRPEHCIIILSREDYKHYTNVISKLSSRKLLIFDVWDGRTYILETTARISYMELR